MAIDIIPFEPRYASTFKDLNVAWLNEYFYVEPKDEILLKNCEEAIIDTGGYIFFARYEDATVGCFSFIKLDGSCYELGKMAVDKEYQGLRIGQELMEFAVSFAKEKSWEKLVLYSSTKLPTALHIYRKYGFKVVELEKDLPYARSDIKMELLIHN
ncbi:GNAT family N-acetyltransferase [Aggregatimonas sangjinii]|uniref:GNAT family N-acetyltransferase n=1 Tax=Aggregatimonas sangjinii TaxID=2583587 RepID=A0A5B7SNR3_9FLAO|nr:GNAT family N-acetyltransferase [Aggregatimonas sangjinii]QCX00167.1 GNAT family N-acetyltransferase [Aggregatimonas sangjinii]